MTTNTAYRVRHWIAGGPSYGGSRISDIHDPATGDVTGTVVLADQETVDRAVTAATEAQRAWAAVPVMRRATVFHRFRTILEDRADHLEDVIVREAGKTRGDARGEIARALEGIDVACAAPQILKGEHSDHVAGNVDSYTIRAPNGVMAGITPFNFPLMLPMYMLAPAIVTGNAFILKPAEADPSVASTLAEMLAEAGLPAGVFTVLHGDRETAEALIDHPDVAAISFVGSTPVARAVYERGSASGKRVQALGGANNHMVVLPDADLESAADALVAAAFGAAGQRCMAVRAAIAVGDAADPLIAAVAERAAALKVGGGDDITSELGPLISGQARDRVLEQLARGVEAGAVLVVDGRDVAAAGDGFFVGPCVATGVGVDDELYREEVFGPLLIVLRAENLEEALGIVARTPYGNGAVIYTRDGGAARRFTREVAAGNVGVNVPIPVPVAWHGFGGWGDSRFGDHGLNADAYGFCTRPKVITERWDPPVGESLNFQAH
ncbi:MAG: CoA-acylating methylmalonate-semialdehyde dehydrogenase [Solirubrobacteraceae bacterium]